MKPLVVDTVFKHGDFTKPAVFPDEKGEVIQLPAKVAASVVWTVTGGFATLVDAQTRTGLPGGLNWGGLTLTGKTFIRNGAALDALDDPKPVLSGAERNQIVLDLGAQNAAGTSGSANFRLTYNPLGEAETWIIRNGVNDLAQNSKTTFDRDSNGKIPWKGTTADKENGNGAVVFEFADQKIPSIDLAGLVPAPVTGEVPAIPLGAGTYKTMEVVWNATAGSKTRFEGETVYAATVTLEPETGFFFRDGVTVTHGGSSSLLYISRAAQKVVVDVLFPKTGVFWEYGGYFSGSSSTGMDSAIDAIGAAKTAGFSSLSLKLLPWPETVDISALSGSDISGGLELTTATNSPASVTIDGGGKTIPLKAGNTVSVITVGNGVTLTLKNITFKGSNANNAALIRVTAGGKLVLQDGAVITGNTNSSSGGGVEVTGNGKLDMTGGEISGNTVTSASQRGGGVYVNGSGEFTMSGGTISGNKTTNSSSYGGGVSVDGGASFVMTGGVISGNTAGNNAGGVYVYYGSTFTMHNGKISGNKAYTGGGVYVNDSTFTMNNGVISGNTATTNGGGVQVTSALTDITFTMNGGKISGNKADNGTGGGVRVSNNNSTFTMNNGEISGNTATTNGGGVYFAAKTFTMHRGIIYGNEDINGDKKNIASTGAAFYKGSGTAQWDESKDGSLKELNTINTTLDLR
jgi:hypothetical protein